MATSVNLKQPMEGEHAASPRRRSQAGLHAGTDRRPRGRGTGRPVSCAPSSQKSIAICELATASSRDAPWAMQPGSSGTSTTNAASSSLHQITSSYLCELMAPPSNRFRSTRGVAECGEPAAPDRAWPPLRRCSPSGAGQHVTQGVPSAESATEGAGDCHRSIAATNN